MATYEIGFKPSTAPTDSSAAITRTFSHVQVDLSSYGSSIASRHLVSAGQKITGAYYYIRASTNGVSGTVTAGAYVTDSGTNAAGARIATWTHGTSSSTPGWNFVSLDVDLNSYAGQYIKPAGGYSVNNRPYYVTGTSGHGVYVASDLPNPYGSPTSTTQIHAMYLVIEDVAVPAITDINTNETIVAGSSGNALTCANFPGTINSITAGGKACTSISGSGTSYTFTMPGYVHAQTYPNPNGSVSLVATDNTAATDDISVTMVPQSGYSCVTISSPITNNSRYPGYWMAANGFTPVNGDKMLTLDADCTGSADTGVSATAEVVTTIWHWVLATGIIYEYTVTINNAGVVSAGITAARITASSITSSALTSRIL